MFEWFKGYEENRVLKELEDLLSMDIPYSRVLSSMCTYPHPIAVKAHIKFIRSNLGDPGLFPGTAELEKRLLVMLGELFGKRDLAGYISSGGTEGNIQAIRAARNMLCTCRGNIVVPESAHFSFLKIKDLLGIDVRKAGLDEEYRVDIGDVERLVDDETFAIVGIAGTTELGQVDDIKALSKLAIENNLFLHVDAAFGGFVLPFLNNNEFNFRIKGVCSLVADPHKMGMATIPSGAVLFRDSKYLEVLSVETPYLTSSKQFTLTGTRPGTGVASAYAVLKHLGFEGMKKVVLECMRVTQILKEEVESLGLEAVIDPVMNVVCFKCNARKVREELMKRGWVVSCIRKPEAIRCVIMPHLTESAALEFVRVLKNVLHSL